MTTRLHNLKRIASIGFVVTACAGLVSCGGGGGSSPTSGGGGQMMIMPPTNNRPTDHSNTPAGATAIALGGSFSGRIDSPNDVDYFRLRVEVPGTLTIQTTGNADPDIAVFDGAGNEVPGVSGSWTGRITQDLLDRGHDLLVRFSGGNAGREYTGIASQISPDLTVGAPSVSDGNPAAGASFTLSATVRNAGDGDAAATTLRYYRSTDATITTGDTSVGTDAVAGLAASGSISLSVDLTAPSSPGTYYYGACVDAVAGESATTNNCSTSVPVTVPQPGTVIAPPFQGAPDLTVGAPSVSDGNPAAGASFTLSATVRNAGDGDAAATTLRYYRSTDATITTGDTSVGTDAVGALAASGTSSESIDLTAPSTAGTYYYGACVATVAGESDTANNCSTSVQVTVSPPQTHPDLVVGTPSVSDSGPDTGASFTLSATVSNTGDGRSAATTLRYYRSTDATITTGDTSVGTDAVGALAASGTSSESIDLTAPSTAGTYYYGACVATVAGESDTANNCSTSVQVTVSPPQTHPDLVVGSPSVSDSGPDTGGSFTLSATVSNTGDGRSAATTLRYYRSADATITTSDTAVGTDAVGALAASGTSSESIDLTAPSTAGTYYYGACVATVAGESNTTNNCSTSVQVTVTESTSVSGPDLVAYAVVFLYSPFGFSSGDAFTLDVGVRNDGDVTSPSTTLRYYRSTDTTITTSDTAVGTDTVEALAASGTSSESIRLTAPSPAGTYYYGACVDAVTGESDTTNNCSAAGTLEVN